VRSIFLRDAVAINHRAQGPNGKMRRVSGIKTKSRAGRKLPILCTPSGARYIASSGTVRRIFNIFFDSLNAPSSWPPQSPRRAGTNRFWRGMHVAYSAITR
jgi:hypothetical protein